MKNEVERACRSIDNIFGDANIVIEKIRNITDEGELKQIDDKVKLMREWARLKKRLDESRLYLLKIEVATLIRMHDLGLKLKAKNNVMSFLAENRNNLDDLYVEYPDCVTATSLYREHNREKKKRHSYEYGMGLAENNYSFKRSDKYKVNEMAAIEYTSTVSAITNIIENLSTSEKAFTVQEMADTYMNTIGDEYDYDENIKRGIREVCRESLMSAKITTVGDKKAPKFVTFYTEEFSKWMRIPFANAKLWQVQQMIDLRKKQLAEDTKALKNLQSVYDELLSISGSKEDERKIYDIIKTGKTNEKTTVA